MKLLIDAQLPPGLVSRFNDFGHKATHVFEMLSSDAADRDVAELANKLGAVLLTKDEDFVDLVARGVLATPLVWVRSGNMTTARLWQLLEPLLPQVEESVRQGDRIIEIR